MPKNTAASPSKKIESKKRAKKDAVQPDVDIISKETSSSETNEVSDEAQAKVMGVLPVSEKVKQEQQAGILKAMKAIDETGERAAKIMGIPSGLVKPPKVSEDIIDIILGIISKQDKTVKKLKNNLRRLYERNHMAYED